MLPSSLTVPCVLVIDRMCGTPELDEEDMLTGVAIARRHRIGTAEVESALVSHELCAEAAVVGFDHSVKGQVRLQLLG